jgi:hypothetical protein
MIKHLYYLPILIGFSIYACNTPVPSPQATAQVSSSPEPIVSPSDTSPKPTPGFCPNISGQIFTNKTNLNFSTCIGSVDNLFYQKFGNAPVEGVEITYGNKKVTSGKDGTFNIPEILSEEKTNLIIGKAGFQPVEITVDKGTCQNIIGLSEFTEEEQKGRDITGDKIYIFSIFSQVFPQYFTKDEKSGFHYYVAKNTEQLEKLKAEDFGKDVEPVIYYLSKTGNGSIKIDDLKNEIGPGKKMLVIFGNNSDIAGQPGFPIDRVTETDEKIIFAEHKSGVNRYSQFHCGDTFTIKTQAFMVPYNDKKLFFTANKFENSMSEENGKTELEVVQKN